MTSSNSSSASPSSFSSCLMVLVAKFLFLGALFLTVVRGQIVYSSNEDKRNDFDRDFLHFGKRALAPMELERHFMNFGKREDEFGRQFMPFGKRYVPLNEAIQYDKKNFGREFLHFGKRAPSHQEGFERDFMTFGKRAPSTQGFERDFMAFGRRK